MTKTALRAQLRQTPPSLDRLQAAGQDALRITDLPLWRAYQTVLLFAARQDEIDTAPLINAALQEGKSVFLPKVQNADLLFFQISDLTAHCELGAFNIREPKASRPQLAPQAFPALIITPALAFDRKGGRLGRGKGFYDRWFAKLDAQSLPYFPLGLCLPTQLLDSLPTDPSDKPMRAIWCGRLLNLAPQL